MKKLLTAVVLTTLLAAGCKTNSLGQSENQSPLPDQRPTIEQGIYGTVTLKTGDCMPGTLPADCTSKGLQSKVIIRELTNKEQDKIMLQYLDYPAGHSSIFIKESSSNSNGYYEASLPAGTYSVFVLDEGREFCTSIDNEGNFCPVTVGNGLTEYNPKIDHVVY